MVDIIRVVTKKQQREFIEFPLRLYRDNPCFVPPLYSDEKKMFRKGFIYADTCEMACFNAYRDGKMIGRIQGILQKASNEKNHEKRIRFNRFDAVNDPEVASALFSAVEDWGRSLGMDTICGPLGFSDLEREGLLVEGFSELSTFEEQYNAEYYASLIESLGYEKEVDWNESKLMPPEDPKDIEKMRQMSDFIMKRYNLYFGPAKNVNDFISRYADGLFELLDTAYNGLYGTVPFSDGMKKLMIDNFRLIIDLKHVAVILDEEDRMVCFGVCFPSIAKAVQPSQGKLTPAALLRLLRAVKKPEIIDLGLIAVAPEYANRGISSVISGELIRMLQEPGIRYAETNLNLEDNYAIQNQWKRFSRVVHKRRRAYVKRL
ncbi:MAG: N-acetyltransferase [Lachnospiraceae bacterium]|nr:N-acetyltransferase [Lachnospiraceae bacterium]